MTIHHYLVIVASPQKASLTLILVLNKKNKKKLERGLFSNGNFSWKGGGIIVSKNLFRTYEKLHCKEEPKRFSG